MPINNDALKQQLASRAAAASSGVRGASGGAPPAGGPQGVFDVSNDGVTWAPAVRLRAGSGTSFVTVNGETTVAAANLGATEYPTLATFRASTPPADGTVFRIVSPPGEYRYSTSSGAGWADDGDTILKPDSVILGANGRAFTTRASAHAATFAAARAMKGLLVSGVKHVHVESRTTFGDGAGGVFDVKDNSGSTYASDNDGVILLAGTPGASGAVAIIRREADVYNVKAKWFGAWSGASDNVTALNNAVSYLQDQGTLDLRGLGSLDVSDTVNILNRQFIKILGGNTKIQTKTGSNFTSKPIVNTFGSSYVEIDRLRVYSTLSTNLPSCGLAIGRTATHQGGGIDVKGGYYYGRFTGAPIYNMCAENSSFTDMSAEGVSCPAVLDASDDPLSLSGGGYALSNFGKTFKNCILGSTGAGSTAIVKFQGRNMTITIDGGFVHSDGTAVDAFLFEQGTASPDTVNDQSYTVRISNVRSEQPSGWRLAHITKPVSDLDFVSPSTSSGAAALVETSGSYGVLSFSRLHCPRIGGAGGPVLKVNGSGGNAYKNDILVGGANTVEVASGAMTVSHVHSLDGDPMFGAAWDATADYGNTISWNSYSSGGKSVRAGGSSARYWKQISGATPDVGGSEAFYLTQSGATNVTNFINGHPGQRITLKAQNNYSTLKQGAYISNKSGSDVIPVANELREYINDGGVWREL